MNSIDELAGALNGIDRMVGDLLERAADGLRKLRRRPSRYVGRHRAPTLYARLSTRWAAARAEQERERQSMTALVEWWAVRRADYAPALARARVAA